MFARLLLILNLLAFANCIYAQQWTSIQQKDIALNGIRYVEPSQFLTYTINNQEIKDILWTAPTESTIRSVDQSNTIITIPMPDGTFEQFRMVEYAIGEPELMAKFPDIKTFYGVAVDNSTRTIFADYTSFGFKAWITSMGEGTFIIDNYSLGNDISTKIVYDKKYNGRRERWFCGTVGDKLHIPEMEGRSSMVGDCQLRQYRCAIAATAEYVDYFVPGTGISSADSTATNIALVHSAVVTSLNRVNSIYTKELAIRLVLVANNNVQYYFNPATDGYTNNNGTTMLGENQTKTDIRIGAANYDIGHVFSTGGGGIAQLNSPCSTNKARGVTGSSMPVGDAFDIDYVAHEMGHQFGGNHTQSNSCQRNNGTAMEPGSASSIQGYAGICSPNVQNQSDATFHAISLQEIKTFAGPTGAGNSCAQIITTPVNSAPVISSPTILSYNIPISTPFALTLNATDPNSNPMTYAWDQMNGVTGDVTMPPASTNSTGPLFRNILPSTNPTRYFPNLTAILAGNTSGASGWEVLPSVARAMNFRGIVRDDNGTYGCNSDVNLTVTTVSGTSKFEITSPNASGVSWPAGSTQTVVWTVGGTTANGINAEQVDILWTTNSGASFTPILLGAANDGSQNIVVPSSTSTTGRIMVKPTNNIFLDINNFNISIITGTPTFNLVFDSYYKYICTGSSYNFNVLVNPFNGYSTPVNLSISGLPAGMTAVFATNPVTPGQSTMLTITNTSASIGIYPLTITGVSGSITKTMDISVVSKNAVGSISLTAPANNATGMNINPVFTWSSLADASSYDLQVSRKPDFGSQIININQTGTSYTSAMDLTGFSEYYWRVRGKNDCSDGPWSSTFKFTTESCLTTSGVNLPQSIPDPGTLDATLNLGYSNDKGTISDLDILKLIGTHTYMGDLSFRMISPNNTNVLFWHRPCSSSDNFNINFDQSASTSTVPCPPTNGLTYRPSGSGVGTLNSFNGIPHKGVWTLRIQDLATSDAGQLQSWKLRTCITNFCRLTVDTDAPRGAGSLLAALDCAVDGDTIRFAPTFMNDTIQLYTDNIVTNKRVFIQGDISKNIHIFSNSTSPTLVSGAPNTGEGLKIKGLHIHSATNASNIGAIRNTGLLTLEDVYIYKSSTAPMEVNNELNAISNIIGNCRVIP
jgi:subtilisin-like proprotein convertase family protein